MVRPIRFEYPGGCYHIMTRGDGGKTIFGDDDDRKVFIARLGEVCGRCGWRIHAWVLRAFELAEDGRVRRAYVAWLEELEVVLKCEDPI